MRKIFARSDKRLVEKPTVTFGVDRDEPKTVHIRKITIAQWKELIDSIQTIPQLIISVIGAPPTERAGYFMVVLGQAFDDIVRVTSILTGLDEEYLHNNAAADELFDFYSATVKANNFGEMIKNGRGVLSKVIPNMTAETQDAN